MQFFAGSVTSVFARRSTTPENGAPGDTLAISLAFTNGAVGSLLLSSLASWDYLNEQVDIVGSNTSALSVENGRQLRVFRRGEGRPAELYENTLSVHWWSGHDEQGFVPQLRVFARQIRQGVRAETPARPRERGRGSPPWCSRRRYGARSATAARSPSLPSRSFPSRQRQTRL